MAKGQQKSTKEAKNLKRCYDSKTSASNRPGSCSRCEYGIHQTESA